MKRFFKRGGIKMNWGWLIKFNLSLILLVEVHKSSSVSPSKTVNINGTNSEQAAREENCLKYDYQIHDALISTKPPFDNYFNISRAIFPSEDISSKLINIWVHFTNSSVNLTQVEQRKYIWSRSCLYVSDRYLSLRAMSIYSLGAIWPDRRQKDLHLTTVKLCNPEETEAKLVEFLSTVSIQFIYFNTRLGAFQYLSVSRNLLIFRLNNINVTGVLLIFQV